ncbi:MAG: hypothetical protein LBT79_06075 [Elusimicrobiota bacterium]|jgi:hypothetical protein|nr:hypothetical protein [Elusimicrobiota bacterium]
MQKQYSWIDYVKKYAPKAIMVVLAAIILSSIIARIIMYVKARSLWLDEAMLAESIVTRNLWDLVASPLVNTQTAPIGYLYVVKLLGILFGYTEGVLRSFSFFALCGTLIVEAVLLKKAYKLNTLFTLLAVCITATLGIYMRYSNELKPYMGDTFFMLIIMFVYYLFTIKKLKLPALTAIYSATLLFSSSALFFITAVYIVEIGQAFINKNWKYGRNIAISGFIIFIVFLVNYIYWLMPVAKNPDMIDYWTNQAFSFSLSKAKMINNIHLIDNLFNQFHQYINIKPLYMILAFIGFIVSLVKKHRHSYVVGISLILLLIASNFEKYPIQVRLVLFIFVPIIIYAVYGISSLYFLRRGGGGGVMGKFI